MHYDDDADRLIGAIETALDDLARLRNEAASAAAEAKRQRARALLEARTLGHTSREERDAYADLQSVDAQEAADITERSYRDCLTYLRLLQSQLDLARTRMVTERQIRV